MKPSGFHLDPLKLELEWAQVFFGLRDVSGQARAYAGYLKRKAETIRLIKLFEIYSSLVYPTFF